MAHLQPPVPPTALPRPPRRSPHHLSLPRQLFERELGRRPLAVTRVHLNAFRRRLTAASSSGPPLDGRAADCLEFLRAEFCLVHLRASFERLGPQPGTEPLSGHVRAFLRLLKEPGAGGSPLGRSGPGQGLDTPLGRKAAFFRHLWALDVAGMARGLLTGASGPSHVPEALFVRNRALALRLVRRLGRRQVARLGARVLEALGAAEEVMADLLQLMAFPALCDDAAALLEDVLHHRRRPLELRPLAGLLPRVLNLMESPRQVAKLARVLVLLCAPADLSSPQPPPKWRPAPTTHSPATADSDNQTQLLDAAPHFLGRLLDVLDWGVCAGGLPRTQDGLDEEAQWFRWLDTTGSGPGTPAAAAVSRAVTLVDLTQSLVLLRVLLCGPRGPAVRQRLLHDLDATSRLCRYVDALVWSEREVVGFEEALDDSLLRDTEVDLLPETPLKLQLVRCIALMLEGCSPVEKRLFLSEPEIHRLRALADFLPPHERDPGLAEVDLVKCCRQGPDGLLTRLATALMRQSERSTFRLWLSKCLEAYLQGLPRPRADQELLALTELQAEPGSSAKSLLEDQMAQCGLTTDIQALSEADRFTADSVAGLGRDLRQQACDTLAAMVKFNAPVACLFFSAVLDSVHNVVGYGGRQTPLKEKLAYTVVVQYFKVYTVSANVLLRAFAVTEAVSLCDIGRYHPKECPNTAAGQRQSSEPPSPPCDCPACPGAEAPSALDGLELPPAWQLGGPTLRLVSDCLAVLVCCLVMAVDPGEVDQTNVSCINTAVLVFVLESRRHALTDFLITLQCCYAPPAEPNRLLVLRHRLEELLGVWRDLYVPSRRPSLCLTELATAWRVTEAELTRVVEVVHEDLRRRRFPFIREQALWSCVRSSGRRC